LFETLFSFINGVLSVIFVPLTSDYWLHCFI